MDPVKVGIAPVSSAPPPGGVIGETPSIVPVPRQNPLTSSAGLPQAVDLSAGGALRENQQVLSSLEISVDGDVQQMISLAASPHHSLSQEINKWDDKPVGLLYYEYQLAKQITGGASAVLDPVDSAVHLVVKWDFAGMKIVGAHHPSVAEIGEKISRDVDAAFLAYKIPTDAGKIGVVIYKLLSLKKIETQLEKNPDSLPPGQKEDFMRWLKTEKKEVYKEAKEAAIDIGSSVPKYIDIILSLSRVSMPLFQLSLTWVHALIGALLSGYNLHKATTAVIKLDEDAAQFRDENFRRPGVGNASYIEPIADSNEPKQISDLTAAPPPSTEAQDHIRAEASEVRNKRRTALLELRDEHEEGFKGLCQDLLSSDGLSFFALKQKLEESEIAVDPTLSEGDLRAALAVDSQRGQEATPEAVAHYENMLVRYIDVNSSQPLVDSTRNALKALTIKKQSIRKNGGLRKLMNARISFAAAIVAAAATVVLSTIVVSGVGVPVAVLLMPLFGTLGLAALLTAVGVVKFYQHSPNLFKEYVDGTVAKMAAYSIPKKIHQIRQGLVRIKMIKQSIDIEKLAVKEMGLAGDHAAKEKLRAKQLKLEQKFTESKDKLERIQGKIGHWEEKIAPLAKKVATAKWSDFLQERKHPQLLKEGGRPQPLEEKAPEAPQLQKEPADPEQSRTIEEMLAAPSQLKAPLGSMPRAEAHKEVQESLEALREGILATAGPSTGVTASAQEIRKILKDRLGVDLDKEQGPTLAKAVLQFAP